MKKKSQPPIQNPLLRVADIAVKFRDKNGRFCKPSKGASFEILPAGKRVPLKGEIPKSERKSVAARKNYVAFAVTEWSKAKEVKKQKSQTRADKKKLVAVKKKPVTKSAVVKQKKIAVQIEKAYQDAGIKKALAVPKIERKASVTQKIQKYVTGRSPSTQPTPKHKESREGTQAYRGRHMEIEKIKVMMDPVDVFSFNAKPTSLALREYFRPHAEKFFNKMRDQSDNAYIMRVMTMNRIPGEASKHEGVGTERFIVRDSLTGLELKALRSVYPGMSKDDILRELQLKDIAYHLEDLFNYFLERYQDYLSKKVISSVAVTGFTMEVVKGVM